MKRLNKSLITETLLRNDIQGPAKNWDTIPVKVLQFGTGVLLRGLPDYFIDKANKAGLFNGRIAVVKSTDTGNTDAFAEQDGLYTLGIKGIENGKIIEEYSINSAIKEVLVASKQWESILQYAEHAEIKVIISNTTEVGITLDKDDSIFNMPPHSFPAKLLAFLYKRFQRYGNDKKAGVVILPTELVSDNGVKLKEIIVQLAKKHQLDDAFFVWLNAANYFCNTLVDRIVPGKLPHDEYLLVAEKLGYRDDLLLMAEPFRLWAIEAKSPEVARIISFSEVDDGMVITPDISKFKELKLRLLNGTHTFTCGLAFLAGFDTVKDAMAHPLMEQFIKRLLLKEIVPTVVAQGISEDEAIAFAEKVLDRFRNPSLDHKWINITLNYTSKMEMRNVALLKGYCERFGTAPDFMALGFASYLLFMRGKQYTNNAHKAAIGNNYPINDPYAELFESLWQKAEPIQLAKTIMNNQNIWGIKLTNLVGFEQKVMAYLVDLLEKLPMDVVQEIVTENSIQST